MPLGPGVRYRYKKGTHIRLAFKGNKVIEAKNTESGATHTPEEFAADRSGSSGSSSSHTVSDQADAIENRKYRSKKGGR